MKKENMDTKEAEVSAAGTTPAHSRNKLFSRFFPTVTSVFTGAVIFTLTVVLIALFFPGHFESATGGIKDYITQNFGWFYLLLVGAIVAFCIFIICSPASQIRLGDPDSRPEYTKLSWLSMLFSAGMGIGLIFFGAAEPLSHFAVSSPVAPPGSKQALADSLKYTFFHWGIHAWAVYGIIALSLAYFKFRKKEKSLLSATLKPLFGSQTETLPGKIIDGLTIFVTAIGVAASLGFGAVQINGGLSYLFGIPNTATVQVMIILICTACFVASALSGIGKGVKILSNLNIILAIGLMALIIILGPSILFMNSFVGTIGMYLNDFLRMSFRTASLYPTRQEWIQNWTIFYWAWWISWAPFVGIFIAHISKGRTIREFLIHVLLVPTIFSFLWFSVFGTAATQVSLSDGTIAGMAAETVLFGVFNQYPYGLYLSLLAVFLIFTFFITSADSATYVLSMLSEDGSRFPHNNVKVIWGLIISSIAGILLVAGGLPALQNIVIISALPFSFVIILMIIALYKEIHHEKIEMGLYMKPKNKPEKDRPFRSYE